MPPESDSGQPSTRQLILECVRSHPGSSARRIQRTLGLGWGETAYHLRALLQERRLMRERQGRRDAYFPPGLVASERAILMAMQAAVPHALLVATSRDGGSTFSELATELGAARSVVAYYLRTLMAAGLIEVHPGPRSQVYRSKDPVMVHALDERFRWSFERSTEDLVAELWGGVFKD